jgi:hypothetical protein
MEKIKLIRKTNILETLRKMQKGKEFMCPYEDMPILSAKQAASRLRKSEGLRFRFTYSAGEPNYTITKI